MELTLRYLLVMFIAVLITAPASAAVVRFNAQLDDGTYVIVDNASGWSQNEVYNLVLAADRSTQHDCVYTTAFKGLFKTGDRIFVNQNYLAWFDYTAGDGVMFTNPPYRNVWTRSGELTGFWSLNPATRLFKYYRTGPNGCWNYPANEMIVGSASAGPTPSQPANASQGQYWWDAHTYAFEHALGIVLNDKSVDANGNRKFLYMAFNYTQQNVARSGFQRVLDGYDSGFAVHYKSKAKMMDANSVTDIYDGDHSNMVQQWIDAEVEYYCRTSDILSVFRFKPTATVTKNNALSGFSSSYGQDMDDTACDAGGAGNQWPSESQITKRARYAQSNITLTQNWTGTSYAPNSFVPLAIDFTTKCPSGFYSNWDVVGPVHGLPGGTLRAGDYIRWGYSPTIDRSEPRWQMINLGDPASGSGTNADPYNLQLSHIMVGNERRDGTLGSIVFNINDQVLTGGKWYQIYVSVSTNF